MVQAAQNYLRIIDKNGAGQMAGGVLSTMRAAVDRVMANVSWVASPLSDIRDMLYEYGKIRMDIIQIKDRRFKTILQDETGNRVPAKVVNAEFARNISSRAFADRPMTSQEKLASVQFKNAVSHLVGDNNKVEHGLTTSEIFIKLRKGHIAPFGAENGANNKETAKIFVENTFPGESLVNINNISYIARLYDRRNPDVRTASATTINGETDPQLILLGLAEWVNSYIDEYNTVVERYNKNNPNKTPHKKISKTFDPSTFSRLDADGKYNLEAKKSLLRAHILFDEKLRPGTDVLYLHENIKRAAKVTPWLSYDVIKEIEKPSITLNAKNATSSFPGLISSMQAKDAKKDTARRETIKNKEVFKNPSSSFYVQARIARDHTGLIESGGYQIMTVIDVTEFSKKAMATKVEDLPSGLYNLQSHLNFTIGTVVVSDENGSVSYYDQKGRLHNQFGPAIQPSFEGGAKEEFYLNGELTTREKINENLKMAIQKASVVLKDSPAMRFSA
jgi:hypothetical protein